VLVSQRSSKMTLDLISPPLKQLHRTWAFVHVGEYVRILCALAPNTPTAPSFETIVALCHLHRLAKVDLPLFVDNFHPEVNLILDREAFIFTWLIPHVFHLVVLWVWCMNFCDVVLSLMTLVVSLISYWRYVGTLLVVMFLH
jgi:hypothetical protein